MTSTRYTSPFTAVQWQELEHQVLVYKHLISGVPIPPELIYTVKRSLDSPFSRGLLFQQPIGTSSSSSSSSSWDGCFQMGFGRKADPEPWRCRRTDGKKWRCSKEAHTDSKYCEKHMHRGKNRSRKPVEPCSTSRTAKSPNISPSIQSSLNRNLSLNITNTTSAHSPSYPFLDTHNSSLTPKPFDTVFSPHEHQLLLDSGYDKDYRQQPGPKVEGNDVSTEKPFHHFFGEWHPKDADSWL